MDILTSLGITKDLIADIVINIGSIVVLFLIVKKLAYTPVKKFMDARTEKLANAQAAADAKMQEAEVKIEEYTQLLDECESAKENAIKEGEKLALEESNRIISSAKQKADEIVSGANKKAQEKYDSAIADANDYIVNLTIDASKVLLQREINDNDNKKIVEDFLNSLDGDNNA